MTDNVSQRILFDQKEVITSLTNEKLSCVASDTKLGKIAAILHSVGLASKVDCQDNKAVYVIWPFGEQIKEAAINQQLISSQKGLAAKIAVESILKQKKIAIGLENKPTVGCAEGFRQTDADKKVIALREASQQLAKIFSGQFTATHPLKATATIIEISDYLKDFKITNASNTDGIQFLKFLQDATKNLSTSTFFILSHFENKRDFGPIVVQLNPSGITTLAKEISKLKTTSSTSDQRTKFVNLLAAYHKDTLKGEPEQQKGLKLLDEALKALNTDESNALRQAALDIANKYQPKT